MDNSNNTYDQVYSMMMNYNYYIMNNMRQYEPSAYGYNYSSNDNSQNIPHLDRMDKHDGGRDKNGKNEKKRNKNKKAKKDMSVVKTDEFNDNDGDFPPLGSIDGQLYPDSHKNKQIENEKEKEVKEKKKKKKRNKKNNTSSNESKVKYTINRLQLSLIDISKKLKETANNHSAKYNNSVIRRTGGYKDRLSIIDKSKNIYGNTKKLSSIRKSKILYTNMINNSTPTLHNDTVDKKDNDRVDDGMRDRMDDMNVDSNHDDCRQDIVDSIDDIRLSYNNRKESRINYSDNIIIREWVDNTLDIEFEKKLMTLINRLSYRYQYKKQQSPMKANKRLLSGFNEVLKSTKSRLDDNRPKLVVIAVDIQKNTLDKGTDQMMRNMLDVLHSEHIPYVFCGTRIELGACLYGKVHHMKNKSSCIGIIDYRGYEKEVFDLLCAVDSLKKSYNI